MFAVWTPDKLIANASNIADHGTFVFQPLVDGPTPDHGRRSLELLEGCIPKLKAIRGQA